MNRGDSKSAFTTIRIRKYDHDRLLRLGGPREPHWEVLRRVLDEYMLKHPPRSISINGDKHEE